jgi:hypothetical protein
MKRMALFCAGIMLLVLVAGAAYVGGQLLNGQTLMLPNGQIINLGVGSESRQRCETAHLPAAELPREPPLTEMGVMVRRDNNSLFMGVRPTFSAIQNPDGTISTHISYDGSLVEIVFTHDTRVFRDITFQQYNGHVPCGAVQQVVERGALNDIEVNNTLLVWGARNGERIVASHLVYEVPLLKSR